MTHAESVRRVVDSIFALFPNNETDAALAVMVETSNRITTRTVAYWARRAKHTPRIEQCIVAVCDRCGVTRTELMRSRRIQRIAVARGIACAVLREALGMSLDDVGQRLGLHHTTVMMHCKKHRRSVPAYEPAREIIAALRSEWSAQHLEAAE